MQSDNNREQTYTIGLQFFRRTFVKSDLDSRGSAVWYTSRSSDWVGSVASGLTYSIQEKRRFM